MELKVKGKKITHAAPVKSPEVINLMDALKKSLAAKKTVVRKHPPAGAARKRKSG